MAPLTESTPVIEESKKIRDRLLTVQSEIESAIRQKEKELLDSALLSLGYDPQAGAFGNELVDVRVGSKTTVLSPKLLASFLPVSKASAQTTDVSRKAIVQIIKHQDDRLMVIVGPCAIHDPVAALEYARHIRKWREKYGDDLEIIMRTYVEKPRSELGWKGFVYDPLLDGSNDINLGLIATRMLASLITGLGVPIAVERLNALTPQYVNSLVAYDVIGARNTTDQKAREYASATSSPVGFKNTPEGSIEAAAQAIVSASGQHAFLGIDIHGSTKQINSLGNDTGHVILRGASDGPNYSKEYIEKTKQLLSSKQLDESIVVDASHGNSQKLAKNQHLAIKAVAQQVSAGESAICGVMIESNLVAGNQKLGDGKSLTYGQSIVDECVDIVETQQLLELLAEAHRQRKNIKKEPIHK